MYIRLAWHACLDLCYDFHTCNTSAYVMIRVDLCYDLYTCNTCNTLIHPPVRMDLLD
jgi:hypothetical protein